MYVFCMEAEQGKQAGRTREQRNADGLVPTGRRYRTLQRIPTLYFALPLSPWPTGQRAGGPHLSARQRANPFEKGQN